ncbi:MAG: transglycosylase SLT domain-containing protein [Methylocystis sp.]|uniref:transglycosylase SLT domain-containing protein n=1 Tax=Methylocystis sp. TaxID=1911079 RepID=UPI003DA35F5A
MTDLTQPANEPRRLTLGDRLALIRADRSFYVLLRTVCVGAVLSTIAALSLTLQRNDTPYYEKLSHVARQRTLAGHLLELARAGSEDDEALDSDFSIEQAALTWAHRLFGKDDTGGDAAGGVMRFGPVKVQQAIVERVVEAANKTEMDPALLMAIADKESNFHTSAKARTSSASGLFQFVEKTWMKALADFGHRYGRAEEARAAEEGAGRQRAKILNLRNDPYLSAAMAAEMLKKDSAKIAEKVGRPLTPGETYLIHFLGPEDTERFMRAMVESPQMSAAALLPKPARANKPIFYEQHGRRLKDRTVTEVHEAFEAMMDKRTSRYGDVASKLPAGVTAYTD